MGGASPLYFLGLWCLLGRTGRQDEWQITKFITEVKAFTFVTGFGSLVLGAWRSHACIVWDVGAARPPPPLQHPPPPHHLCEALGPGTSPLFGWELCCFAVQCALVWAAFLRLPFSNCLAPAAAQPEQRAGKDAARKAAAAPPPPPRPRARGRAEAAAVAPEAESVGRFCSCLPPDEALPSTPVGFLQRLARRLFGGGDFSRGGLLRPLMRLDAYGLLACASLALYALWRQGWGWEFLASLWWCRALYGTLHLPFAVFLLPGTASFVTLARPTAYMPAGRLVLALSRAERKVKRRLARVERERAARASRECSRRDVASIEEEATPPVGSVGQKPPWAAAREESSTRPSTAVPPAGTSSRPRRRSASDPPSPTGALARLANLFRPRHASSHDSLDSLGGAVGTERALLRHRRSSSEPLSPSPPIGAPEAPVPHPDAVPKKRKVGWRAGK